MRKILLFFLISTPSCFAMEKIWHSLDIDSSPVERKSPATVTLLNNGGSLDWLPLEIVAHITSFILTGKTDGHFYYKCKQIKHLLMASKRYYHSPRLTDSIVCQIAHGEGRLGALGACLSLHTPASKQWLKNWLQNHKNLPRACHALHIQTTLKQLGSGFVVLPISDKNLHISQKVISALVEAGVPVDIADKKGRTALMKAIRQGEFELGHFLITLGANVLARDNKGRKVSDYHTKGLIRTLATDSLL